MMRVLAQSIVRPIEESNALENLFSLLFQAKLDIFLMSPHRQIKTVVYIFMHLFPCYFDCVSFQLVNMGTNINR